MSNCLFRALHALVRSAGFSLKTQPRLLLLNSDILSRLDYCNCLLMGTPNSVIQPLQKFRTLLQDLFSWHPVTTTQHLSWKKLHWLPISERIKYKVACMCFSAINGSGPAYLSEPLHVFIHSVSYTTLFFWHPHVENPTMQTRLMAFAPSLALDPTFGIHSHKTLDTAQPCHFLKPNWKPSSSDRPN